MPDDHWFLVQGIDDLGGVIGYLLQRLLGEDVRVRTSLFNRWRTTGDPGWRVGGFEEARGRAILTACPPADPKREPDPTTKGVR